jgi:uncharacterized protein YkwD
MRKSVLKNLAFLILILAIGAGTVAISTLFKAQTFAVTKHSQASKISMPPLLSSESLRAGPETVGAEIPSPSKPAPRPKPASLPTPAPTTQACASGSFSEQFLCLLNAYRQSQGKGQLAGSNSLSQVAFDHSAWMAATGTFSHTGPNGDRLGDRCGLAGIACRAENLAHNAKSAQHLLDMWTASPSHNKNLLGNYTAVGMGISGSYITLLLN